MDVFQVIAKIWPTGDPLDLGTDSSTYTVSYGPTRTAAQFATSPDGTQNYQFLFWNTGRRTTRKRSVHWTINNAGWGTWTATKWYGTPGGGVPPGAPRVRADAFTIRDNAPLAGTPIDSTSTYAPGAWSPGPNDHVILTAAGPATVVPKDPFPGPASSTYDFAGWLQLLWGGDPANIFEENDAGTSSISTGSLGFYASAPALSFPVAMNASADLIATYGTFHSGVGDFGHFDPTVIREWIYELFPPERGPRVPGYADPSPIDFLRMRVVERMLQETRPGSGGATDFQRLIASAPKMSQEELKRAIQSIKTTLDLGNTALTTIEGRLKGIGK